MKVIFKRHYFLIKTKNENGVTILSGLLHPMIVNYSQKWLNYLLIKCIYLIGFKKKCTFKSLIAWAHITVRYHPFVNCFISWYLVQIINFLLIELPTILFAVWSETIGCIYFICPGCAEHVLANEVVLKTLREQTEQCAGCTTF